MGKKRYRTKRTSKGIHSSVSKASIAAARSLVTPLDKLLNKQRAWLKGQNPWLTVASSSKAEKNNRPFERVRANDYWGKPSGGYMGGRQPSSEAA